MKKAFSFDEPTSKQIKDAKPPVLEINGESFDLADMTGLELVKLMSRAHTTEGVYIIFSRGIRDDDWDRFGKVTAFAKPKDFSEIAAGILDLYTNFPTTADEGS